MFHDVKDNLNLQDSSQELSMSSKYDFKDAWYTSIHAIKQKFGTKVKIQIKRWSSILGEFSKEPSTSSDYNFNDRGSLTHV